MKRHANDNHPASWLCDAIALMCILALGYSLILAGAAFGINHCRHNDCAGYEEARQ